MEQDFQLERRSRTKQQNISASNSLDKNEMSRFGSRDFNDQDMESRKQDDDNGGIVDPDDVFEEDEDGNRIITVQKSTELKSGSQKSQHQNMSRSGMSGSNKKASKSSAHLGSKNNSEAKKGEAMGEAASQLKHNQSLDQHQRVDSILINQPPSKMSDQVPLKPVINTVRDSNMSNKDIDHIKSPLISKEQNKVDGFDHTASSVEQTQTHQEGGSKSMEMSLADQHNLSKRDHLMESRDQVDEMN